MLGLLALVAPLVLMAFAIGMEKFEEFAKKAGRRPEEVSSPGIESS